MCLEGVMKSTINPHQGNQSEVGNLKEGPLEHKTEAQFQPLNCNILFSRLELQIYNFLNMNYLRFPCRCFIEQTDKGKGKKLAHSSGNNSCSYNLDP